MTVFALSEVGRFKGNWLFLRFQKRAALKEKERKEQEEREAREVALFVDKTLGFEHFYLPNVFYLFINFILLFYYSLLICLNTKFTTKGTKTKTQNK